MEGDLPALLLYLHGLYCVVRTYIFQPRNFGAPQINIWELFACTSHKGPTTDTAPTNWNPRRVSEVVKPDKDKTGVWVKSIYPGMYGSLG